MVPGSPRNAALPVRPMGQTPTRYHISLDVADRPGVLAQVAQVFAAHGVSIAAVRQRDERPRRSCLVVVDPTWRRTRRWRLTVNEISKLDVVREVLSVMRVEGEDS